MPGSSTTVKFALQLSSSELVNFVAVSMFDAVYDVIL